MTDSRSVITEESDIPLGMTVAEWIASRGIPKETRTHRMVTFLSEHVYRRFFA